MIELSFSQKRKYSPRLADGYILGSDSDVCVVVGLDIEDETNKKASFSVWRRKVVTNEVGEKELIHKPGSPFYILLAIMLWLGLLILDRFSAMKMETRTHLAPEAFRFACETSLRKP